MGDEDDDFVHLEEHLDVDDPRLEAADVTFAMGDLVQQVLVHDPEVAAKLVAALELKVMQLRADVDQRRDVDPDAAMARKVAFHATLASWAIEGSGGDHKTRKAVRRCVEALVPKSDTTTDTSLIEAINATLSGAADLVSPHDLQVARVGLDMVAEDLRRTGRSPDANSRDVSDDQLRDALDAVRAGPHAGRTGRGVNKAIEEIAWELGAAIERETIAKVRRRLRRKTRTD